MNAFGFARKHSNPPRPLRGMVKEMIPCTLSVREAPIAAGEAAGRVLFRLENRKSALPSGSVSTVCTVVKNLPLSPTVVGVCEAHASGRADGRGLRLDG